MAPEDYHHSSPQRNSPGRPIRDDRATYDFRVKHDVIDRMFSVVGGSAFGVYCLLVRHAAGSDQCYPSRNTIARTLGLSRETVQTAMKKLEASGLIEVVPRYGPDGERTTDMIVLKDVPPPPENSPLVPQNSGHDEYVSLTPAGVADERDEAKGEEERQQPADSSQQASFSDSTPPQTSTSLSPLASVDYSYNPATMNNAMRKDSHGNPYPGELWKSYKQPCGEIHNPDDDCPTCKEWFDSIPF